MNLTPNFTRQEFDCNDSVGTPVPAVLMPNVRTLAAQLQILRDYLGEPIHVNSGYRTPQYNKSVGGAKNSQHLLAKAADITVKSKTPKQIKSIVERLIKSGKLKIGGIGLYKGFLHVDTRSGFARW